MCRARFSPYEADWWEWSVRQCGPGTFEARPLCSNSTGCLALVAYTNKQLARDISNAMRTSHCKWKWNITRYVVESLNRLTFSEPTSWLDIAEDSVLGSDEEQEETEKCVAAFMRLAKPKSCSGDRLPKQHSVKKIHPVQPPGLQR